MWKCTVCKQQNKSTVKFSTGVVVALMVCSSCGFFNENLASGSSNLQAVTPASPADWLVDKHFMTTERESSASWNSEATFLVGSLCRVWGEDVLDAYRRGAGTKVWHLVRVLQVFKGRVKFRFSGYSHLHDAWLPVFSVLILTGALFSWPEENFFNTVEAAAGGGSSLEAPAKKRKSSSAQTILMGTGTVGDAGMKVHTVFTCSNLLNAWSSWPSALFNVQNIMDWTSSRMGPGTNCLNKMCPAFTWIVRHTGFDIPRVFSCPTAQSRAHLVRSLVTSEYDDNLENEKSRTRCLIGFLEAHLEKLCKAK